EGGRVLRGSTLICEFARISARTHMRTGRLAPATAVRPHTTAHVTCIAVTPRSLRSPTQPGSSRNSQLLTKAHTEGEDRRRVRAAGRRSPRASRGELGMRRHSALILALLVVLSGLAAVPATAAPPPTHSVDNPKK